MAKTAPDRPEAINIDDLVVLNDEIVALVRAGVPLERGLMEVGGDLPGRLGRITAALGQRMESGETLSQALADRTLEVPPVYRAVIAAGARGGRLAAALETVGRSARRLVETRQMIVSGLLYPLLVFLVAWQLFVFFVISIVPALARIEDLQTGFPRAVIEALSAAGGSVDVWGPAVPLAAVLAVALWWWRSSRATLMEPGESGPLLGRLPWTGPMLRSFRVATFAEVLALLIENDVPLPEALDLAAEAVGERRLMHSTHELAESIRRGETPDRRPADGLPPVLDWMIRTGRSRGALLPALENAADIYRRRAARQADAARIYVPVLMMVWIGGGITLTYALLVLGPWFALLRTLAG